jgi:CheY-like chemotaxis protein
MLAEVKRDPRWRSIPVLVLTVSQSEEDVQMAYDLHANCYLTKPVDFHQFRDMLRRLLEFWCALAVLPRRTRL